MSKHEDVDLTSVLAGDSGAWKRFAAFATPIVFTVVRRTLVQAASDLVADLVQDVFLRLCKDGFRLLHTYDADRASLSTWLALVARSTTIDYLRRRRPELVPLDEMVVEPAAPEQPIRQSLPLPADLLTDRQLTVMKLLYDKDLDVSEVASLLSISEQTVRSTRHKAVTRLRQRLKEDGDV